jgi:hypothetical protein
VKPFHQKLPQRPGDKTKYGGPEDCRREWFQHHYTADDNGGYKNNAGCLFYFLLVYQHRIGPPKTRASINSPSVQVNGEKRKIKNSYAGKLKEKKWAEARREEEEDFNLSPWFIVKPFSVLISFLPTHSCNK